MAKKKAAEKTEPVVVAKCDNLYGIETRRPNEQVERFHDDFMFQPPKRNLIV